MEKATSEEDESLEEFVHVINLPSYPLNVDYIPPQPGENDSFNHKDLEVTCCSYPTEKIEDKPRCVDKNEEIQIIHKSQSLPFRTIEFDKPEPADCTSIVIPVPEPKLKVQNVSKNSSKTSIKTTAGKAISKVKICNPEVKKSDFRVHDNEKHLECLFQDPPEIPESELEQLHYTQCEECEENGLEDLLNPTSSSSNSNNVNYTQSESNLDMYKTTDLPGNESPAKYSQSEGGDCNFSYEDQILDSIVNQNQNDQQVTDTDGNVLHYQVYYPENAYVIEPVEINNNYNYNCTCCSELSLPPMNVNGFNYIELPQQVRHFCNQNDYMRNCMKNPTPSQSYSSPSGSCGGGDFFFQSCERNLAEEKLYRKEILKIKAEERIKFQDEQFLTKNMKYRERTVNYGHKSIWDRKKPEQPDQPEQSATILWKYSEPKSGTPTQTVMNFSVSLDYWQPHKGIHTDLDRAIFFRNSKGLLNVEQSKYFSIDPPMIHISKFDIGQKYTFSLTLINHGKAFRRYSVVQPENNSFDVKWGSVIGQASTLSSGMRARIELDFKPKSIEAAGYYFLTILVQDDGGVIVPIYVQTGKIPILISDELDCGSSNVGNPKIVTFEYANIGHPGRFWILTEDEFEKEYLGIGKGANGDDKEMTNVLISKPFKLYPSCFHLEKNEKILINVFFLPSKEQNYYRKLAILCDTNDVRFIALRGCSLSVDSQTTKFIEICGSWKAPPCDLPSEIDLKRVLDFGDVLSMGETVKQSVTLRNDSQLPVYFFWSVRPLSCGRFQNENFVQNKESLKMFEKSIEESIGPSNLTESGNNLKNNGNSSPAPDPFLRILPSHALIDPGQIVECDVVVQAGEEFGYHSCAISLFTQYPDEPSMELIKEMLCSDFLSLTSPILFTDLLKYMPQKDQNEQLNTSNSTTNTDTDNTTTFEEFDPTTTKMIHYKPQPIYFMNRIIDKNENLTSPRLSQLRYNLKKVQNGVQYDQDQTKAQPNEQEQVENHQNSSAGIADALKHKSTTFEDTIMIPKKCYGSQSILKPFGEIEIWYRSIPLNCWFEPAILTANGFVKEKADRTFTFFNESEYPIQINWEKEINESYSLVFEPIQFVVRPHETITFRILVHFHKYGKISKDLKAIVNLPIMSTFLNLPMELEAFGPSIDILTPALNFGLLTFKSKGLLKLLLSNPGNQRCKWRATIVSIPNRYKPEPAHKDGESGESKIDSDRKSDTNQELDTILKKSVKIWPEWGILNPGEVASSKVYFFAEVQGSFSGAIQVLLDENPEFQAFIPLMAEVQSPTLILKNSKISLDTYRQRSANNTTTCFPTLINPNSIPLKFSWLQPIGKQKDICHISIIPSFGIVPEYGMFECGMKILAFEETHLTNLIVPCCVEGQEIPLLLKITGNIFEANVEKDSN